MHSGDPDREGQLLVDEVLQHLGWKGPTERLLVTDLSPAAVQCALRALEPNERFRPLYEAALARQRADWLYGLNLTRLYTLRARLGGYQGVLSVGRVQTPLLGLIVRRDREIERFVSKPFYGVHATFRTADGAEFRGHWAVGKEHEAASDPEGRLLSRPVADAVSRKVAGQPAVVATHDQKQETEAAPLPYSLADLQVDAGRKLGLSAAQVLEIAQRLYERQLITYPRSDCGYLPEEHFAQARGVLDGVVAHAPRLSDACAAADVQRRGKAWNDAKITAHHPNSDSRRGRSERFRARPLRARRASLRAAISACLRVPPHQSRAPHRRRDVYRSRPPGSGARVEGLRHGGAGARGCDRRRARGGCAASAHAWAKADGIGTPATRAATIETLFERGLELDRFLGAVTAPARRARHPGQGSGALRNGRQLQPRLYLHIKRGSEHETWGHVVLPQLVSRGARAAALANAALAPTPVSKSESSAQRSAVW